MRRQSVDLDGRPPHSYLPLYKKKVKARGGKARYMTRQGGAREGFVLHGAKLQGTASTSLPKLACAHPKNFPRISLSSDKMKIFEDSTLR